MASKKDLKLTIPADQVMYFNLSVSKDGYKSARVIVKKGDKEYMSIGYEWEGPGVPDFVMSLMGFVQANKEDIDKSVEENAEEYQEYSSRTEEKEEEDV